MKSPTIIREDVGMDLAEEVMHFALKAGVVVTGLIGICAFCALVSAVIGVGPVALARGYITAITGM